MADGRRRRDPFSDFRRMFDEMDRMFSGFFGPGMSDFGPSQSMSARSEWRQPVVDLWEDDDAVMVTAELPGVNKDDIDINVRDGYLELSAESSVEQSDEDDGYRHYERQYSGFYRTVPLPTEVKEDQAEATFENGVLEVKLPKTDDAKKAGKKIEVH